MKSVPTMVNLQFIITPRVIPYLPFLSIRIGEPEETV